MDMIPADHDQKEERQDQKVGCVDGSRRLGAGMERRTREPRDYRNYPVLVAYPPTEVGLPSDMEISF